MTTKYKTINHINHTCDKPTSGRTLLIVGFKDDERRMVRTISMFEILCNDEE